MKTIQLGQSTIKASQIALGCMRMDALSVAEATNVVNTSLEQGINFYDHADIYGQGTSEVVFKQALESAKINRDSIYIQSKCGIRPGYYDFSKEHIISSVEGSLTRLGTDYLDVLALHRPDALMEPEEIASAFYELKKSGKVRNFGVSNLSGNQVRLLQEALVEPLLVNQLQFGLKHAGMVAHSMNTNMENEVGIYRDGGLLDEMRLKKMTVQAWSPFQYGYFDGIFIDHPEFKELNEVMDRLAEKYSITKNGLAVAWINRHPANIQTIIGTMNIGRITEITTAADCVLSRKDWYELYQAAGYELL